MPARYPKPVFIVGSPRSGTTWLYHILLASGDFAIYRSESQVYSRFAAPFGQLRSRTQRQRFLDFWLKSEFHHRSGLDADAFAAEVLRSVQSPGAFLERLMSSICEIQGATRWAECTPDHGLYIKQIRSEFPDARFIHLVRDGRDVATSLAKIGFIAPLRWGTHRADVAAALYWSWINRHIAAATRDHGDSCLVLRYEDLVTDLEATLERLARFIDKPLPVARIEHASIGSISKPNSSFAGSNAQVGIAQWRDRASAEVVAAVEAAIGNDLTAFGYERAHPDARASLSQRAAGLAHTARFEAGLQARRLGLGGRLPDERWDESASPPTDPTLRPGQNLAHIRELVKR